MEWVLVFNRQLPKTFILGQIYSRLSFERSGAGFRAAFLYFFKSAISFLEKKGLWVKLLTNVNEEREEY
jgi:hypothetical protein